MKVKPKLYLNMSPQTAEEGSLAFARNMKIDDDGNLISDYGYKNINAMANYNIVGHIVGLDNKIYFFCYTNNISKIVEYDESTETDTPLNTHWTYGDGEIDGYVSTNISGEKILTIAEYVESGRSIPLKHINLSYPDVSDESLYTQAPKCPTANLVLDTTYVKTIPNGVYVFFIRYKIRKDVYTNWFLCSRPIFGGTSEKITTLQGGLNYINLHKDSAKSFIFDLNFAQTSNIGLYKEFQLGFIITHDEATDARTWKHFNMSNFNPNGGKIYFDYEDVEEANIDDLLETTYELYNVRNVTAFKNKLYISNYIESDFDTLDEITISNLSSIIDVQEVHSRASKSSYKNMSYSGIELSYNYDKGYYDETAVGQSIASLITHYGGGFNYDISNLAKLESKEKQEVLKFDICWNSANDPDLATIYNIYNNLYGKVIFGADYGEAYGNGRLGMIELYQSDGLWIFGPDTNNPHPWYNLGFTFSYGSSSDTAITSGVSRNGCWFFNINSGSYVNPSDPNRHTGWPSHDLGFSDFARTAIEDNIKKEIENNSFFAKCYLVVTSGANTYTIDYQARMDYDNYAGYGNDLYNISNEYCTTKSMNTSFKSYIQNCVYEAIKSYIVGIDENGSPVLSINNNIIRANSISVVFKKFDFTVESEDIETTNSVYIKRFKTTLTTTDYTSLCTFAIKNSYLVVTDSGIGVEQKSTLMPLSTYDIYVHLVDSHNIITNGFKIKTISTGVAETNADIISLNYSLTNFPTNTKYKSLFFSIVNVGNIVIEGFGYAKDINNDNTHILNCLEIDSLLYNINDNINIQVYNGTTLYDEISDARYYSSGSTYPPLAFGNCGYVSWTKSGKSYTGKTFYIIIERNKSSENINNLPKSSGYIPIPLSGTISATPVPDGYYGSWFNIVKKPDFGLSSSCYVSGNDVYAVNRSTALSLTEFKNYIQVQNSITYFIRSNYNLNYLSLTEDISDKIFTVGTASSGVKQVARVINSATLSFIYELKSMYKDFFNKYFRRHDTDYKIDFDNTIRVSYVLSDETFNNSIFKFGAEDYYNVPTDRGIIVNLFSIGNNIYVHTKGSLYKFDATQTITASDKDIQLQESEPFDVGISQIFDSEYGYGGIFNKQAGCITFDSYFFYDQESNHIFAYGGNGQVQLIDASIYKLLNYYKPEYCRTLHDDANHRVLFEFTSSKTEGIFTLSFNYKSKSFVSFHDISLDKAFISRNASYSYRSALVKLFDTSNGINQTILDEDLNIYSIYGAASAVCIVQFGAANRNVQDSPFIASIVCFPRENFREVVDYITYLGDVVQTTINENSEEHEGPDEFISKFWDVIKIPQVTRNNPVKSLYIITDTCVSTVVDETADDTIRPENLTPETNKILNYKGFKYVKGFWNANYFRNAINTENIYSYEDQPRANQNPNSDNYSLVYGRYFILNFAFITTSPIKFEELFINTQQY